MAVFKVCVAQRWLVFQPYKYCRSNFRAHWLPHRNLSRFTKGSQFPLHCQSQCNRTVISLCNGRPQYRLLSSSPAALTAPSSNEPITPVSDNVASTTPDILETSAHAQWASDAAQVAAAGDLASLGLGGYSPIGLIQSSMEWIHVHTGLPWWASVVTCTLILRTALFPIAIKMQANTARMNNIRPDTEKLMAKIKHHNRFEQHNLSALANKKLLDLYREHNCSPLKLMLAPFVQIPIFISFFIGLRRMAAAPVESMKTGGTLWFTDLTLPDSYYVLPLISCGLLLATIEMGGEAGVTNPQLEKMKTFFRAFTILLVPITAQFPSALFMYWLPSSLYSIAQILLLKIPSVRSRLGIPELVATPAQAKTAASNKGFLEMVKENYRSASIDNEAKSKKMAARKRYNQLLKDKSPKLYDQPPQRR